LELLPDDANMWSLYAALLFTESGPSYQGKIWKKKYVKH